MADTKISALPASTTPLAGTEVLPIVQSGVTKQVSVANLTAGRAVSAASVTASTGNFVVGTSGQGVDFSATPGTGTSELLNDYEEGTWAPIVTPGAGSLTSYTSSGTYTKVGRVVCLTGTVLITSAGTASGQLNISGLPFTASVAKNQLGVVREDQNTGFIYFVATTGASTNAYIQSSVNGSVVWTTGYGYVFSLTYIA